MSQAPIMPMATDAMIADTTHLTAEEFGAYHLILYATWRNNGVPLPDDHRRMARVCRVTPTRWRRLREVLSVFFDLTEGCWRQKRLEKEWNYVKQRRHALRQNGAKGGRAKALKLRKTPPANGSPGAPMPASTQTQSPNPKKNPPSSPRGEESDAQLRVGVGEGACGEVSGSAAQEAKWQAFWAAYPSRGRYANPQMPAREQFLLLLGQGVPAEEMTAGAKAYARDMADEAERRLVAQAQTFLKQCRWEQYSAAAGGGAGENGVPDPAREALVAARWAARAGRWATLVKEAAQADGRLPPFIKADDIARLEAQGLITPQEAACREAGSGISPRPGEGASEHDLRRMEGPAEEENSCQTPGGGARRHGQDESRAKEGQA